MAESPPKSDSAPGKSNSSPPKSDSSPPKSNSSPPLPEKSPDTQQSPSPRSSSSAAAASRSKGIAIPKPEFNPLDVPIHHPQVDSPLRKMLSFEQQRPVPPFLSSGKSPDPSPPNSPRSQQPSSPPSKQQPSPPPPSQQPPRAPLKQQQPSATEEPPQASHLTLLRNDVVVVGLLIFALGYATVRSFIFLSILFLMVIY